VYFNGQGGETEHYMASISVQGVAFYRLYIRRKQLMDLLEKALKIIGLSKMSDEEKLIYEAFWGSIAPKRFFITKHLAYITTSGPRFCTVASIDETVRQRCILDAAGLTEAELSGY
jgi:hypothetical protein